MLLAIILYRVNIRKFSAFCPLWVDKRENVGIVNSSVNYRNLQFLEIYWSVIWLATNVSGGGKL